MKKNRKSFQILASHLRKLQKENPKFSLRALGIKIGVSHAFITNVFNGKRLLPTKRIDSLCDALKIDEFDRAELNKTLLIERSGIEAILPVARAKSTTHEELLPESHLRVLRYWWNLALLDLLTCAKSVGLKKEDFLKKISVNESNLDISLNELLQLKLISFSGERYYKTDQHLKIPTRGPNPTTRQFYKSTLTLAQQILDKTTAEDFEKRLVTHISCAVNPKKVPEAKLKLAEALAEIRDILTEGECTDVYFLQAQLFSVLK